MTERPTALIAEDEPLLAEALQAELARAWPELRVVACPGDGHAAVERALALRPDVLLFDVRMPGRTGLEAAVELAEEWRAGRPFPALVFVTAYDEGGPRVPGPHAVEGVDPDTRSGAVLPVQRGTVVRGPAIDSGTGDEAGRLHLALRGRPERLPVSRLSAYLFKAM